MANQMASDKWVAILTAMTEEQSIINASKFKKKKLSERNVREIRARLKNGESQDSIAFLYDVGQTTISDINNNRTWKSH